MALTVIGMVMISLQLAAIISSYSSGTLNYFTNVTNFSVFIYDLIGFLSFNLVGIIGLVLLIIGVVLRNRNE